MMRQTPGVVDQAKPVRRQQQAAADLLDAINATIAISDQDLRIAGRHRLLRRITEYVAVGADNRSAADQRRPAGMDAGNAFLRPEGLHSCEIARGESAIVKFVRCAKRVLDLCGVQRGFVLHA